MAESSKRAVEAGKGRTAWPYEQAALAALKLLAQLSGLTAYGWFRDELYYVACSEHLAWGYVDHPPLSIFVLRIWRAVFGESLAFVRLFPAIAGAAIVVLTMRMVRALDGGRNASIVAGLATLCAPGFFGFHHYWSMNTIDHLVWSIAGLLVARPMRPTKWIGLGVLLGLGGLNKWSVAWLAAGLALGLLTTEERRALRSRWPYVAVTIGGLLVAPHVAWQVSQEWPTLEFMKNALAHKYVERSFLAFVSELALLANPAALPLLLGSFGALRLPKARPLAVVFFVTLVLVGGSRSGKAEYVLAAVPLAFAAGAAFWERQLTGKVRWIAGGVTAIAQVVLAAITFPFGVPVLSEASFVAYAKKLGVEPKTTEKKEMGALPQFYADMHGWEEITLAAKNAFESLPPEQRARAKIWARTGGYGTAAAVDLFGVRYGLPKAIATHNSYFSWGYGDDDRSATVIVLGGRREALEKTFEELTLFTIFRCAPWCMPYEDEKPIWIARTLRRSWNEVWTEARRFE